MDNWWDRQELISVKAENNLNGSLQSTDLSMTKTLVTLKNLSLEFNAFRQHSWKVATNLNMKYSGVGCQLIIIWKVCQTNCGVVEMKASYKPYLNL